ncbi:hypothetical protein LWI28_018385 [Acer negundo]|uniref:AB hydrolase-1 domain-containing protein n=1 Tax=Acer negundo TaxID=4023 RepID=A0AAD5IF26_ACENE|nr:hypothetical protein LWI28_018385 [Acer negundo]
MAALLCVHSTFPNVTVKPLAVLNKPKKLCVPFELKQGQTRLFHQLPSGLNMEGESDAPAGTVAGSLQTHAGDIADFIQKNLCSPPVLLGHSFGGLIIQYSIAKIRNEPSPELAGAVLVCSVPPSGNSGLVWRYLFSKPIAAFKVTRSLAAKAFQTDLSLCKETFFSSAMGILWSYVIRS